MMRRATITLSEELGEAIDREARIRRTSFSETVRTLLEQALCPDETAPREIPWANIGSSEGPPWAENVDEYLVAHWASDIEAGTGD